MRSALNLARTGLGRTAPNPSVGCVIVKNGTILARARTADTGRPHAETMALAQAGRNAKGASLYVTLQPCSHQGKTPPCTEAIIDAGIKTVIIGASDPNPKVNLKPLEDAGIEIITGILEDECSELNAGFFLSITQNRPFITLKMACTLDGKIACAGGESKWITGELARKHAHLIRSKHDAILIGSATARADQPLLTTRLPGIEHDPVKIVLGKHDQKFSNEYIIQSDPHDLPAVLKELAKYGVTRLLVEGGAQIHTSFLTEGLCDELLIYRAATLIGDEHQGLTGNLNIKTLTQRFDLERKNLQILGPDVLERYIKISS